MTMKHYSDTMNQKATPQNKEVIGKDQVKNSAGGYVFAISPESQLKRFLVLGSEGGSYYVKAPTLTEQNAKNTIALIRSNGKRVVDMIIDVSTNALAPKNDPALFALALCTQYGNTETKKLALKALPLVARTGTHLFDFVQAANSVRGWGRTLKNGVANWYLTKSYEQAAYQMVKYRQRNGWSHGDVLRLAHPNPGDNKAMSALFKWATNRGEDVIKIPGVVAAFEEAKTASDKRIVDLIHNHNLPWEAIPTDKLNSMSIQEALLEKMPITATMRNLNRYTKSGLVGPMTDATSLIIKRFTDESAVERSKVHPLSVLMAMRTYSQGHSLRGHGDSWTPVGKIVSAMEDMFYLSFKFVKPSGKKTMIALDVSASMTWDTSRIAGTPLTAREASAAMAMVSLRKEPQSDIFGFSSGTHMTAIPITDKMDLNSVIKTIEKTPAGGTDCSLPMTYAGSKGLKVETFQIYTDNETWAGRIHPFQALKNYRQSTGINSRLIVVGMVATSFSIADPSDPGMLDVVGFDSGAPAVMADFSAGRM